MVMKTAVSTSAPTPACMAVSRSSGITHAPETVTTGVLLLYDPIGHGCDGITAQRVAAIQSYHAAGHERGVIQ